MLLKREPFFFCPMCFHSRKLKILLDFCSLNRTFASNIRKIDHSMRKVLLDAHTHTVASGHAYSSLQEMARAAADMGLEVLGITEHGPSVPGTCPTLYFKNMFVVPRRMYGVRLLMGCEINILDTKGNLDLTDEQIGWLDIAIAGVHAAWYQAGTKEENTQIRRFTSSVIRATALANSILRN